jgi:hypothetical protein
VRWRDRIIGIALGVCLGVGVVVFFVFVYSERTVDAPSLSGGARAGGPKAAGGGGGNARPPVATVRVIGGTPPSSGPAELHYRKGDLVRLKVVSNLDESVELLGYGISRTVPANRPTPIRFKATKAGNFPLVVRASHIDVARVTVGGAELR